MCKGSLPELELTTTQNHSVIRCTFRSKTSLAATASQAPDDLHEGEHHLPTLARKDCSSVCLDGNCRTQMKSDSIEGKKFKLLEDQHKIRPKTAYRVKCHETFALGTKLALSLNASPQIERNRKIVVFLPPEVDDRGFASKSPQPVRSLKHCDLVGHLPDINATHLKELDNNEDQHEYAEIEEMTALRPTPSRYRCQSHSTSLPLIDSNSSQEKRLIRRVQSHDLENHLKQADEDYDKFQAKASMLHNWMKTQNDMENVGPC